MIILESATNDDESSETNVASLSKDLLKKLPPAYNMFEVKEHIRQGQSNTNNSMNAFLIQEIEQMNKVNIFFFLFLETLI